MNEDSDKPIMDKRKILAALKADLKSASILKSQIDDKITEWKDAYEGKPYGNEVKVGLRL